MTPEEIAARLPQLTHGPHHDQATIALAEITAETVRVLNHATRDPGAITEPATLYAVTATWPRSPVGCRSCVNSSPAGSPASPPPAGWPTTTASPSRPP